MASLCPVLAAPSMVPYRVACVCSPAKSTRGTVEGEEDEEEKDEDEDDEDDDDDDDDDDNDDAAYLQPPRFESQQPSPTRTCTPIIGRGS